LPLGAQTVAKWARHQDVAYNMNATNVGTTRDYIRGNHDNVMAQISLPADLPYTVAKVAKTRPINTWLK